jgi:hypothetical protein
MQSTLASWAGRRQTAKVLAHASKAIRQGGSKMSNQAFENPEKTTEKREARMIRKYKIDFEFADGVLIGGYTNPGREYNTMTLKAFTAADAETQAEIEIKGLSHQYNRLDFTARPWRIIRISPVADCVDSPDAVPSA